MTKHYRWRIRWSKLIGDFIEDMLCGAWGGINCSFAAADDARKGYRKLKNILQGGKKMKKVAIEFIGERQLDIYTDDTTRQEIQKWAEAKEWCQKATSDIPPTKFLRIMIMPNATGNEIDKIIEGIYQWQEEIPLDLER